MSIHPAGLSSNWKKLQGQIKSRSSRDTTLPTPNGNSKLLKRKARPSEPREDITSASRAKKLRKSIKGGLKMGNNNSSTSETQPAELAAKTKSSHETDKMSDEEDHKQARAGKYIAIDCEMVGTMSPTHFAIKSRNDSKDFSILARVSLVTYSQDVLYDTYVLPPRDVRITDYRTQYSGITPWHLNPSNATTKPKPFEQVQEEVAALMDGRILVGHAIRNDLAILGLSHPARNIRDTGRYPPFRAMAAVTRRDGSTGKGRTPALKMLAERVLGWDIQSDAVKGHSSVEDAKATMALFQREKKGFEQEALKNFGRAATQAAAPLKKNAAARKAAPMDKRLIEDEDDDDGESEVDEDEEEDDDDDDLDAIQLDVDMKSTKLPTAPQTARKSKKRKKKKGQYHR